MVGVNTKKKRIEIDAYHQNGIKEPLMCAECDNALGKFDGYTNRILNHVIPNLQPQGFMGGPVIVRYLKSDNFDYDKFRKFIISLVWRFSVSSNGPNLGKYEDIALKILKGEIKDDVNLFLPLIYRKITGISLIDDSTLCGHVKYLGKHTIIFKFPGYEIRIIINTKNSSDNELMQHFKTYSDINGIMITDVTEKTPTDNQLLNQFSECQKALFETEYGKKRLAAIKPKKNL
ncbi:MAG: hypothetical protein JXR36_06305 [Bacteroidales bacterium]|nr:hypothetical protein [Bacteroidales bacterium]